MACHRFATVAAVASTHIGVSSSSLACLSRSEPLPTPAQCCKLACRNAVTLVIWMTMHMWNKASCWSKVRCNVCCRRLFGFHWGLTIAHCASMPARAVLHWGTWLGKTSTQGWHLGTGRRRSAAAGLTCQIATASTAAVTFQPGSSIRAKGSASAAFVRTTGFTKSNWCPDRCGAQSNAPNATGRCQLPASPSRLAQLSGLHSYCRKCHAAALREGLQSWQRVPLPAVLQPSERRCASYQLVKPRSGFSRKSGASGIQCVCKGVRAVKSPADRARILLQTTMLCIRPEGGLPLQRKPPSCFPSTLPSYDLSAICRTVANALLPSVMSARHMTYVHQQLTACSDCGKHHVLHTALPCQSFMCALACHPLHLHAQLCSRSLRLQFPQCLSSSSCTVLCDSGFLFAALPPHTPHKQVCWGFYKA